MRRILLILLLCLPVEAANEVRAIIDGAPTAYFVIREIDGDIFYPTDDAFEVFGTSGHTMDSYDIVLTDKSGGFYVGDFDTDISAGQYYIIAHQQAGGSPANADPPVWEEQGDWNGAGVWTPGAIVGGDTWNALMSDHTVELSFGGEVQQLDPNITLILADTTELQTDWTNNGRLDVILDKILYWTERLYVLDTTVDTPNDANGWTITAGLDVNDTYSNNIIRVTDVTDGHAEVRWIQSYQVGREVFVEQPLSFIPAAGDKVQILSTGYGGWLYEMLRSLKLSKAAVYYTSSPDLRGGAAVESAGGTTQIDQSGADPPH